MKSQLLTIKSFFYSLFIISILFSCNGCSSESVNNEDPKQEEEEPIDVEGINTYLASLANFSQPEEANEEPVNEEDPERDQDDTSLECVTKHYKASPGFNEMILLDPTSDVIYPGAMLKGESIPTGEYIGINGGRAPMTLSVSLENLNGKPSTVIENPSLHTVREGVKNMLQQGVTGSTAAKIIFTEEEVYSEEHLDIALAASYTKGKNSVSGSFDFSSTSKKYRYIIKYLQVYYTIDLTLPPNDNPGSLFTSQPNLNSTSPVIVSSVKYGRMLLYTVETDYQLTETKSAFSAAFNDGTAGANGEYEGFWSSSTVKALVIGGSGGDAAKVVEGPSGAYEYITSGGDYSADSPGLPLGYTLRYIKKDFPIARVVLSTEYQIKTCDLAYPEYLAVISKITGTQKSDTEVNGSLRVKMWVNGERLDINNNGIDDGKTWSVSENNAVDVQNDKTHTINDHIYTFKPYRPNQNNDYIECSGELYDYNGVFGNESLGNAGGINKVYLSGLLKDQKMDVVLDFKKGITAHFEITRTK